MEKKLIKITDITKNGWELYINNLDKFLMPILILMIVPVVTIIFNYLAIYNFGLNILILAASIFISLWISIIMIMLTEKIHKKEKIETRQIYREAFSKIPSYLWVSFLVGLVIVGGLILLIIPGIIFAIWFEFAPYINVLEKKNNQGLKALSSSKELIRGRWWPTFWRLVLPALFVYIIVMVIVGALTYILNGGNIDFATPNSQTNLILNGLSTLILTFLSPLFLAFVLILYYNLKETRIKVEIEKDEIK